MSWSGQLYQFPRAAITGYHGLGGLNNGNLLSHSSGDYKSEIKLSDFQKEIWFLLRAGREGSTPVSLLGL